MLRIAASKVVAEAMLEEINQILGLKKTVSHDLDLISADALSPEILEQVGAITNSVVQLELRQETCMLSVLPYPSKARLPRQRLPH